MENNIELAIRLRDSGKLRWCNSQICACMGCANHEISKEKWNELTKIPFVDKILKQRIKTAKVEQQKFINLVKEINETNS